MDKNEKNRNDYYVIDVAHVLKSLWRRAWIILLVSILVGASTLVVTRYFVPKKYSASVMMYVNNKNTSGGVGPNQNVAISQSDMSAKQQLVKTYAVILNSNATLQDVIDHTGIERTCDKLRTMIDTEAVDETEVFRVTVTSTDPDEATLIARAVTEVLPEHIDVIDGTSTVTIDDTAVPKKVSPNITKNTIMGAIIGFFVMTLLFAVIAMLDDTIRSEEYVAQNYDVPILAKIPDLMIDENSSRKYAYYYKSKEYKRHGYEYKQKSTQGANGKRGE